MTSAIARIRCTHGTTSARCTVSLARSPRAREAQHPQRRGAAGGFRAQTVLGGSTAQDYRRDLRPPAELRAEPFCRARLAARFGEDGVTGGPGRVPADGSELSSAHRMRARRGLSEPGTPGHPVQELAMPGDPALLLARLLGQQHRVRDLTKRHASVHGQLLEPPKRLWLGQSAAHEYALGHIHYLARLKAVLQS